LAALALVSGCTVDVSSSPPELADAGPGGPDAPAAGVDAPALDGAETFADAPPDPPPDARPFLDLLVNGDIEAGVPPWMGTQASLLTGTGNPHGGTRALIVCKMLGSTSASFSVSNHAIETDAADPIAAGRRFQASAWVRAFSLPTTTPSSVSLVLREDGGAAAPEDNAGPPIAPSNSWAQVTTSAVIDRADRERLTLIVQPADAPTGSCFMLDDAAVWEE
jgi:hypothetical protein